MEIRDRDFAGGASGREAVQELGRIIREKEKTRRLLIVVACALFIVASLVIVFAPPGKESISMMLGAALIVIALGAVGAASFHVRAPGMEIRTNPDSGVLTAKVDNDR